MKLRCTEKGSLNTFQYADTSSTGTQTYLDRRLITGEQNTQPQNEYMHVFQAIMINDMFSYA